jgi:hypothetical protein
VATQSGLTACAGQDAAAGPAPTRHPGEPPTGRHWALPTDRRDGAAVDRGARARRVARALAAAGGVCLLGGATMLAAGPVPDAAPFEAPTVTRAFLVRDPLALRGVPVVDGELARLLAGEAAVPEPVGAGTPPVELVLPVRDVRAPVVAVTTGPEGALLVPDPPATVGWWSPSALVGSATGTTVLAGHVDTVAGGIGALAVLRHVAAGEEVALRGADGRTVGYRVTTRRQYAKAELPPEVFAAGGPPRLVLITCGGEFDRRTRHYADNVVVFAELVPRQGRFGT